ncbi:MAG TPA: hypothetical protein VGV61_05960, partial [Thermoanaerobaculia bacterium]|nr:hypothetical protein [Thermoanaerobaculia bacterium]
RLAAMIGRGDEVQKLGSVLTHLANLGNDLGDEIAAAGWLGADGHVVGPVAIAPVADPAGFRAHLASELDQLQRELGAQGEGHGHLTVVTDETVGQPAAGPTAGDELRVWVSDAHRAVVVACTATAFNGIAAALGDGSQPFRDAPFHATIADRYAAGVDGLLAVDLGSMVRAHGGEERERLERLGLAGVQHLLLEQWSEGTTQRREAVLSFDGARHGIASWLAAPAPMGALSFFSPDSTAVAAFVMKEPALLLEDVLAGLSPEERERFATDRARFQSEHGWDPLDDLARPLGGEVAMGIDGPVVPQPAWKVVVEVYAPDRLQSGIERLVADADTQLRQHHEGTLTLAAEGDGWVIQRTRENGTQTPVHYRYQDGYLVASATAGLVDNALRYRAAGQGLLQSPRLRALLPPDRELNLSALWYQDLSGVLGPIAGVMKGLQGQAEGAQQQAMPAPLRDLAKQLGEAGPTAVFAYGEEDKIRLSSSSPRNPLGLIDMLLLKGAGMGPLAPHGREAED